MDPAPESQAITESLSRLRKSNQELTIIQSSKASCVEELAELDQLESDMADFETALEDFQSIEPNVLVAPFRSETVSLQNNEYQSVKFITPAVIVLLLQHLAATISALVIIREQRSGTIELFWISPLNSFETLLGKYLSYLIFGSVLGAAITASVVLVLQVPTLGNWINYAAVLFALLFTALGFGFLNFYNWQEGDAGSSVLKVIAFSECMF